MIESTGPDLSFQALSAWVAPMADDAVVGQTDMCTTHPLALFAALQGFPFPFVTNAGITWDRPEGGTTCRITTQFEHGFAKAVQEIGRRQEVTAGQVRAILADLAPKFGHQAVST